MSSYHNRGGDQRDGGHRGNYGGRGYGQRGGGNYNRGWKRKRDDGHPDERKFVLKSLITLGDPKGQAEVAVDSQIEDLARALRRDLANKSQQVQRYLLDCAIQLGYKTPYYAVLLGLLNVEEREFVGELITQACHELEGALEGGDILTARMLMRFFGGLVVSNVLHPSSVLSMLCSVMTAVNDLLINEAAGEEGSVCQYYTDHVVHSVLMTLPWGGSELAESAANEYDRLFGLIERYFEVQPRKQQPALKIFFEPVKADDEAASGDCGTSSAVCLTWEAVQQCRQGNLWEDLHIPYYHQTFEAQLATGMAHELPPLKLPTGVPGLPTGDVPIAEQSAALMVRYPPRGIVHLLAPEHTVGDRPLLSRIMVEDYVLDILTHFEGDRVECARRMVTALPIPWKYESLLAEIMFSQLLRVPKPQYVALAYSTIMVDLCKLMNTFPRSMSACVRECFARVGVMEPELRSRLAEWLAYHLSNFEYVWPWDKWKHVLEAPLWDSQRRFVVCVLSRLIRLSYWERVKGILPESFQVLLPPKPEPQPLGPPQAPPDSDEPAHEPTPAEKWALELVGLIRQRTMADGVLSWIQDSGVRDDLILPIGILRMAFRAMLVAGSKSFTHMIIVMERYISVLQQYIAEVGHEGEIALMDVASEVWAASPQRTAMAADRLLALRIVSGEAVVAWVFKSAGVWSVCDEIKSGASWEILYNALDKMLARTQDAALELKSAQQSLTAAEEGAKQATEEAAAVKDGEEIENGDQDMPQAHADPTGVQEALKEAEEQLAQRTAYLHEAQTQQSAVILLAARSFAHLLSTHPVDLADELDDEEQLEPARQAWYDYTLAALKGFLRKYNQAVSMVAHKIQHEVFAEESIPAEVRDAVVSALFL